MDKKAINVLGFTEGYGKTIGKWPLAEGAVLGGLGGVGGYYGSQVMARKILDMLLKGKSPAEREAELRRLREDGTLDMIAKVSAGLGAAAGIGYVAQKHMDTNRGFRGAVGSILDPSYYNRNAKSTLAAEKEKSKAAVAEAGKAYTPLVSTFSSGRKYQPGLQKAGSYGMHEGIAFSKDRVPIAASVDLIKGDPFLSLPQKDITTMMLEGAENSTSGLVSGKSLMRTAIQAGVGAGTGFLFGRAASTLFSLPPVAKKRLSGAGAIAGALVNTGIFSEIMK